MAEYPDFEKSCGYGSVTGIGGINCRHSFYPFVEGVSERTYTDEELANIDPPLFEYEGRTYTMYEATQKQREIERSIRKQKRLASAYKAAGLKEDATSAGIKQKRLEQKYTAFSKAAQLPEQKERLKVFYTDHKSIERAERLKNKRALDTSLLSPSGDSDGELKGTSFDLDKAKAEYAEFIKTVPENRRMYLQKAFEGATYQITDDLSVSFAYTPQNDTIVYNPSHLAFKDFSFEVANTHELAHRIDLTMFFNSYSNGAFVQAIEAADRVVTSNPEKFLRIAKKDEIGYMVDIFSAVTDDRYLFDKGHKKDYWQIPKTKPLEVFADMLSMEVLRQEDFLDIIKENFPELAKAYYAMWE